jgi:thymidylate synthase
VGLDQQEDNMETYQEQYANITKELMENPDKVSGSRIGDINSKFSVQVRVDLQKEFPLMEIKAIKFSNIVHELLWMIKGDTNIKYLVENGCHIWTDDAYRYYREKYVTKDEKPVSSKEEFVEKVLNGESFYVADLKEVDKYRTYRYGDLDKVYGYQWRNFGSENVDQIKNAIDKIKNNPLDRRIIVTAHNPSDIEADEVGLPSCHNYFQFYVIPKEEGKNVLNTFVNMRSNDWFLGQPYNMAQYALLTHIITKITDCEVGTLVINSVDAHLYHAHFDAAKKWLNRYDNLFLDDEFAQTFEELTKCNSTISFNDQKEYSSIEDFTFEDIILDNYIPDGYIKAPLLT